MALSWITPKTNWKASTPFTYTDYNRIRNNLLYLNEKINAMNPEMAQELDLGEAKTGYTANYHASEFNAFEDALESFTRIGGNANKGERNTYYPNTPFIGYKDLNRIESSCLSWKTYEPPLAEISLSPEQIRIKVGETQQLTIVTSPTGVTYTATYKSDNTTAATVDANGLVTGVGDGQFTIMATVKSGGKTYKLTASGRIQSDTVGSFFIFNNQKYYYDFIYAGGEDYIAKKSSTDMTYGYFLVPVYRTTALVGKWGNREIPYIWDDIRSDYRQAVDDFVNANFSKQLKDAIVEFSTRNLSATANAHNEYGYILQYAYGNVRKTSKYFLPYHWHYKFPMPSEADPSDSQCTRSHLKNLIDFTPEQMDGVPLINGTDKGQLMPIRMKNGDDYTMARYLNGNIYNADYDELLPLRPWFAVRSYSISVYSIPNDDGVYSIDWTKRADSIPIHKLTKGVIIRDDTGTGRTG